MCLAGTQSSCINFKREGRPIWPPLFGTCPPKDYDSRSFSEAMRQEILVLFENRISLDRLRHNGTERT